MRLLGWDLALSADELVARPSVLLLLGRRVARGILLHLQATTDTTCLQAIVRGQLGLCRDRR